jgi:hypothetical protein
MLLVRLPVRSWLAAAAVRPVLAVLRRGLRGGGGPRGGPRRAERGGGPDRGQPEVLHQPLHRGGQVTFVGARGQPGHDHRAGREGHRGPGAQQRAEHGHPPAPGPGRPVRPGAELGERTGLANQLASCRGTPQRCQHIGDGLQPGLVFAGQRTAGQQGIQDPVRARLVRARMGWTVSPLTVSHAIP